MGLTSTTTRRYSFQSIHCLPALGEGKHGHDFKLELCFAGTSVELADKTFKEKIEPQVHGRDLSELLDAPTGEALVQWIHKELLRSPLGPFLLGVALQETPKNRYISSMTGARFV
jgi:6-pyruvoyl-tetrahydropterin synthase